MQLTPQLVDTETQSCSHRGYLSVLIIIVIMVESGTKRSRNTFIQDRAPLSREVAVLITIVIV